MNAKKKIRDSLARGLRWLRPVRRAWAGLGRRSAGADQIHRVWAGDPARRLGVAWRTISLRQRSWLELRAAGASDWQRQPARARSAPGPRGRLHFAEADALEPGGLYEYRVGVETGGEPRVGEVHRVRLAAADRDAPFTAVFFADTALAGRSDGRSDAMPAVVDALLADAPLLLLGGGDYVYANSDDRFLDPAAAIDAWLAQMEPLFARSLFMPTWGNHEIELGERLADWAPRFVLPAGAHAGRSHSFDVGAAHFCALFAPGRLPDRGHLDWLERDLREARARGARWLIVYQHAPLFAHGVCHPAREEVRSVLQPLFERLGVDLHLSAHDQSYECTAPLRAGVAGDSSAIAPAIEGTALPLPTSDRGRRRDRVSQDRRRHTGEGRRHRAGEGVVYAKVSPSGKRSDRGGDFSRLPAQAPAFVVARNDDCHHYARLRVEAARLEVEIVGIESGSGARRCVDRFAIEGTRGAAERG